MTVTTIARTCHEATRALMQSFDVKSVPKPWDEQTDEDRAALILYVQGILADPAAMPKSDGMQAFRAVDAVVHAIVRSMHNR